MANKVLIVDDSTTIRMQVRNTLEKKGFEVVEATNGREGVEIVRKMPELLMAVVDINMPLMNGIEFTREVKQKINPSLTIIVLTTEGNADYIEQAKAAGARAYLIKPFNPAHLEAIVKKIAGV